MTCLPLQRHHCQRETLSVSKPKKGIRCHAERKNRRKAGVSPIVPTIGTEWRRWASSARMRSLVWQRMRPILDRFHQWLTVNRDRTLPKSPIGLAIAYCLTHWDGLLTYLTDGRIEIDNNATERAYQTLCHRKEEFLICVHPARCGFIGGSFFA